MALIGWKQYWALACNHWHSHAQRWQKYKASTIARYYKLSAFPESDLDQVKQSCLKYGDESDTFCPLEKPFLICKWEPHFLSFILLCSLSRSLEILIYIHNFFYYNTRAVTYLVWGGHNMESSSVLEWQKTRLPLLNIFKQKLKYVMHWMQYNVKPCKRTSLPKVN